MNWFATQVDRDFNTGRYGDGIRLYDINAGTYTIISGVSFKDGTLIVKNSEGETFTLNTQPNIESFKESLFKEWKDWDTKYGKNDEDRTDYEPWCYNSLETLAMDLGLFAKSGDLFLKSYFREIYEKNSTQ